MWGFDEDAVKVLENMRPADENLIYKYAILLGEKAFKPVKKDVEVRVCLSHPNFRMHVLHTVLFASPKVLTRRISLTIKSFFRTFCVIQGFYC